MRKEYRVEDAATGIQRSDWHAELCDAIAEFLPKHRARVIRYLCATEQPDGSMAVQMFGGIGYMTRAQAKGKLAR